jgi:hypothetical protein
VPISELTCCKGCAKPQSPLVSCHPTCSRDVPKPNLLLLKLRQYLRSIAKCMPVWQRMTMKRTALFLKEEQLKKLLTLSEKTGAPVAELIRRAIDKYLQERAKELK